jgi:S-adenosylmethionine:diacylglycerol 3-amino-3-carboxypropyl transferase
MYEDAEIERTAFEGKRRVFCIASAGSTALRLADRHDVVACDINPVQLAYAERRARGGAAETGDAERVMRFARAFQALVGWRASVVRAFLALSNVSEQMAFWRAHLDTRRFRVAFDTLMSPVILRVAYAPRFISVLPRGFGAVLRKRMERGFARHPNATNPYARALLLGEGGDEPLPRAPNIRFVLADAASWLESCPARSFDGFSLSNILDGTEPAYGARLWQAVHHAASDNAVVVWRSFREPPAGDGRNHAERDRSLLWGVVEIR